MLQILSIVLPVFGLIAAGFVARLTNHVGDRTADGLSDFVYAVGVPCLLFKTLMSVDIPSVQPWGYWLSYFGGTLAVWLAAAAIMRPAFEIEGTTRVVAGFSSAQSNTALVGIPLILHAYGSAGAVPLFLLIAVHLPIMMSAATILAEGRGTHWTRILRQLAVHPILIGIVSGALLRLAGVELPSLLKSVTEAIGNASIPVALFAMGMALRRYGFKEGTAVAVTVTAFKLVVHPALVWVLATRVFDMPPVWAGVAVLFASSPVGINCYLLAAQYGKGEGIAASSITLSTALSVFSTAFWLYVLGIGF